MYLFRIIYALRAGFLLLKRAKIDNILQFTKEKIKKSQTRT